MFPNKALTRFLRAAVERRSKSAERRIATARRKATDSTSGVGSEMCFSRYSEQFIAAVISFAGVVSFHLLSSVGQRRLRTSIAPPLPPPPPSVLHSLFRQVSSVFGNMHFSCKTEHLYIFSLITENGAPGKEIRFLTHIRFHS